VSSFVFFHVDPPHQFPKCNSIFQKNKQPKHPG
jgi:hypothetical protein